MVSRYIPWITNTIFGYLHVAAKMSDNKLWERHYDPALGQWTGWKDLGSSARGPAMAFRNFSGQAYSFFCSSANQLSFRTTTDGNTWTAPATVASGPTQDCGVLPAAVTSGDTVPKLTVFTRNSNGTYRIYVNGPPWQNVGTLPAGPAVSDLAAAVIRTGDLMVFARMPDGRIGYTRRRPDAAATAFSPWISLDTPMATAPAVVQTADSHLMVFAIGTDGHLYYRQTDFPHTDTLSFWSAWTPLGGPLHASTPAAVESNAGARIVVFARGTDNKLYHKFYDNPTQTWFSWSPLDGGKLMASGPGAL